MRRKRLFAEELHVGGPQKHSGSARKQSPTDRIIVLAVVIDVVGNYPDRDDPSGNS